MNPNACVSAINRGSYGYPLRWRYEELAKWLSHGGFAPSVKLTAEARRKMVRAGFGQLARRLDA